MTSKKQLKARVRTRMVKTGESYMTARRTVAGQPGTWPESVVDHGYRLRGGLHPESATIANILAHHGFTPAGAPVSEAIVFGVGGGPGAGYILWEFAAHNTKVLVLAFRNQWQYPDRWLEKTLRRLGVGFKVHYTSGAKGGARRLREELDAGRPCLIRPDWALLGYWGLPDSFSGHGGHSVVAYRSEGDMVFVDDRNVSPLGVPRSRIDAARDRITSYRNVLHSIDPASEPLDAAALRDAVRAGLADCVEHLSASSDSFSLPAWRKWSRLVTDTRNAKAWPRVFANGQGLVGALLSTWESAVPVGMSGGHLRELTAEFLDEAAQLLADERLTGVADDYRQAATAWQAVADAALPEGVGEFARLRELTCDLRQAVADPAAAGPTDAAAEELWELRARLDREPPLNAAAINDLLAGLGESVARVYELETAAVDHLRRIIS